MDGQMASSRERAAASGPDSILGRVATLPQDKRAEFLRRLQESSAAARWIVRHSSAPDAAVRLFCFSHAGGGGGVYRAWPAGIAPAIEVWGVRLPGRESRAGEPPYRRMVPLAAGLVEAIGPHLDKPFVFFGHSMGALVAFEVARELRRSSMPQPARLFLAAFRAPHLPRPNVKIYHWPDEVLKIALRTDGTPAEVLQNEKFMQALLPTTRADMEVCDTYEYAPEPPLDCPFSVFGGLDDVRVRDSDLQGWRTHTSSACSVSMLPGTHFFLHSARQVLLDKMQQDLEKDGMLRRGYCRG
jgi:surfactin synthase thioesterase subunit